jgi:hypothetical protein
LLANSNRISAVQKNPAATRFEINDFLAAIVVILNLVVNWLPGGGGDASCQWSSQWSSTSPQLTKMATA